MSRVTWRLPQDTPVHLQAALKAKDVAHQAAVQHFENQREVRALTHVLATSAM